MWTIRKEIKKGDYLYALVPEHPKATKNGYILYHRVVMENSIGRLLTDNEEVHHKDLRIKHFLVSPLIDAPVVIENAKVLSLQLFI